MANKKERAGNIFCHIYLIILSAAAFFPLVWVLLCSVKSSGELTSEPTRFLPKQFTFDNFAHVIRDLGFAGNIGNSLIIAVTTTGIAIVISSMAAYGIVRFFPKLGSAMSVFHGHGKARAGEYENRSDDRISVIQCPLCRVDAGGIFQNGAHRY